MCLTIRLWKSIPFSWTVPDGVMAAQMTLAHWIEVRIFVGQPLKYLSGPEDVMNEWYTITRDLFSLIIEHKSHNAHYGCIKGVLAHLLHRFFLVSAVHCLKNSKLG